MQRVGILGGTFDPPHLGHLILAEYAADALGLTDLLIVPAGDPPHKQHEMKTPIHHRLEMLKLATQDNPSFRISRVDIDRAGPHYSLEMVRIIQQMYPEADLFFVMGGDSFHDLPSWYQPEELIRLCRLGVMRRPLDGIEADMHAAVLPGLAARTIMIDAPILQISSSDIVERIRAGRSVRYLVPDIVLTYIKANRLYQNQAATYEKTDSSWTDGTHS
ncbi:MAG: nicotinate (nicotinamide) nucleotide adenylyltransferase [Anaerolineaceae bacterium]|nr:nicotinate (nicotinamide) nucleotide adenylyltransferase [Anaerolineaceae bacterium]